MAGGRKFPSLILSHTALRKELRTIHVTKKSISYLHKDIGLKENRA